MKTFFLLAVINGFLAVALGAFGAHGLEGKISTKALNNWQTAVHYQMFHTIAIFIVGLLMMNFDHVSLQWSGWLFVIGILLFSGSLFLYAITGMKFLAMMTPLGGVTFLAGWFLLGYAVIKMF